MSRIVCGLMRIANLSSEELEKLIEGALELGIDKFDIADIYGRRKCELLLGEVLKKNPELRKRMHIQSKVGIAFDTKGYDSSYDYLVNSTIECINRLECGYLDCLLIHRPDIFMDNEEIDRAITYLIENGYIKNFGVSNFSKTEIEYLQDKVKTPIKYNQVQLGLGNTTMIDQTMYTNIPGKMVSKENDDLFFFLKRKNIAIQCWSPYQMGFFEGSIFNEEKYPAVNETLKKYAAKYNTNKCAIATAFLLKLDKNLLVVTGSTDINHIKESVEGENVQLSKEDWYRIYNECGHMLP